MNPNPKLIARKRTCALELGSLSGILALELGAFNDASLQRDLPDCIERPLLE